MPAELAARFFLPLPVAQRSQRTPIILNSFSHEADGQRSRAAELIGIDHSYLYWRMRVLGINVRG